MNPDLTKLLEGLYGERSARAFAPRLQALLETFQAAAHRRWLGAKLRQPRWLWRQTCLLRRIVRTQGWRGLWSRVRRGADILFARTFR